MVDERVKHFPINNRWKSPAIIYFILFRWRGVILICNISFKNANYWSKKLNDTAPPGYSVFSDSAFLTRRISCKIKSKEKYSVIARVKSSEEGRRMKWILCSNEKLQKGALDAPRGFLRRLKIPLPQKSVIGARIFRSCARLHNYRAHHDGLTKRGPFFKTTLRALRNALRIFDECMNNKSTSQTCCVGGQNWMAIGRHNISTLFLPSFIFCPSAGRAHQLTYY